MRTAILGVLFGLALASPAAAANRPQASLEDLTLLTASGISDETILVFLDTREIGFEIDAEAIARLRQQGVSEEVIRHLLERTDARSNEDRVIYISPAPYPRRYYSSYYDGYGAGSYLGAAILGPWLHGNHWVGNHHPVGGPHLGVSIGYYPSYGAHYTGGGYLTGGHLARGHRISHRSGHRGFGHSNYGHGGGRHGRGRHGRRHGGGH